MIRTGWLAAFVACAALSCGDPEPSTGTLELHFAVGTDARGSTDRTDPLRGTVHGDVLYIEDVTGNGPAACAVPVAHVRVDGVDLTASEVSSQGFHASLPAGAYAFLGFFDLDANAEEPALPDKGDPATTPTSARDSAFDIGVNEHTEQTVVFDFTLPFAVPPPATECNRRPP